MTVYAPTGGGGAPTFPVTNTTPPAGIGVINDAGNHSLFVVQDGTPVPTAGKMALTLNPSVNGSASAYINATNYGVGGIPVTLGGATIRLACTAGPNSIFLAGPRTQIGDQGSSGATIHSNSGAPPNPAYTAAAGDLYFRTDTPGTANQRVYICTAAGNPGTWVGIL